MREYYSVPFRMAFMEGGAKSYMAAFNAWNGIPMIVNQVLKNVVAKEWGAGWVVTPDAGALAHVVASHKYMKTLYETTIAALKVGVGNLGMGRGGGPSISDQMKQALSEKLITEADIDDRLFLDAGQNAAIVIATEERNGIKINPRSSRPCARNSGHAGSTRC